MIRYMHNVMQHATAINAVIDESLFASNALIAFLVVKLTWGRRIGFILGKWSMYGLSSCFGLRSIFHMARVMAQTVAFNFTDTTGWSLLFNLISAVLTALTAVYVAIQADFLFSVKGDPEVNRALGVVDIALRQAKILHFRKAA